MSTLFANSPAAVARLVAGAALVALSSRMTAPFTLAELFPSHRLDLGALGEQRVRGLATDSRRVTPGEVFFALPGARVHGERFARQAVERGAIAVVAQGEPLVPKRAPVLQVADVGEALRAALRLFFACPENDLRLTGLAGSSGKTMVAHLWQALTGGAPRPGLVGTIHYAVGERTLPAYRTTPAAEELYPLLAQMRDAGCRSAVLEVSSHALVQGRVTGLPFADAAFLNLSPEHLDYHGDFEGYFDAVARLFDGRNGPPPARVLLNQADPFGPLLRQRLPSATEVLTFGRGGDVRAEGVQLAEGGAIIDLVTPWEKARVRSPLAGRFNVDNVLAAVGLARWQGTSFPEVAERLAGFGGVRGRLEEVPNPGGCRVFVDYAHTPTAYAQVLEALREITPGRILVVFGCGGDRDPRKRPEVTRAVLAGADRAFATADNPRSESVAAIFADMRDGVRVGDRIHFIHDRRQAIGAALDAANPGDTVLLAGKGHEAFQEWAETVTPFDDRAVARAWLTPPHAEGPAV